MTQNDAEQQVLTPEQVEGTHDPVLRGPSPACPGVGPSEAQAEHAQTPLPFPGVGPSEAQTEHTQTPLLALYAGPSEAQAEHAQTPLPFLGAGPSELEPTEHAQTPLPFPGAGPSEAQAEPAQTLALPSAASGLGVETLCAEISARRRPAPLPSFNDLLVLVCAQL